MTLSDPYRSRRPVTAVVLDMDGVLIDTEPAWRAAEAAVFGTLGIHLSEADLVETTGQPVGDLVAVWRQRQPQPGGGERQPSDAEITDRITGLVMSRVLAGGEPMPGVTEAIGMFRRCGLRLAIASSSPLSMIDAVCRRLGLSNIRVRCSAVDEVNGKPAPDVYLAAARRLGVAPASCLAIEDSPNGITAATSAGMRCLAIPDPLLAADPRYRQADLVLPSLTALTLSTLLLLGVQPDLGPPRGRNVPG